MIPGPIDAVPLVRFQARVRQAVQARSKDVRLSSEEANELSAAIGQMTARLAALEGKLATPDTDPGIVDGGSFR